MVDTISRGFRSSERRQRTDTDHPPFGAFVPAPGHQLGFGDLKTIEAAELLAAIRDGVQAYPSMQDALGFERVIHAIADSARQECARITL
ncbi:hypothetical protein [Antarctobacter heliothermus]|uniref:Uncharacterized protein n=1 Tax=Antarctobacter heliothermus TaxID=74033 RepID=A0A239DTP6_9RHOB|nr:hypothetical protein [Antarctobacter heliothermus]SNS34954.1 hypothetical protein SAMN04488078_1011117 [Antarctobacter heliothermus]